MYSKVCHLSQVPTLIPPQKNTRRLKQVFLFILVFALCYFPVTFIEPPVFTVTPVPAVAVILLHIAEVVTTGLLGVPL